MQTHGRVYCPGLQLNQSSWFGSFARQHFLLLTSNCLCLILFCRFFDVFAICCPLYLCDLDDTDLVCPATLPDSWIAYPNNHKYDGIPNSDSDLDSCQMTCTRNSSCTSLDWSTRDPPSSRCWLHGPWSSSESRRSTTGVTHYELRRTAIANWVKYLDMHVYSGIATNSVDRAGCQQDCVNNASCTRLDWSASASTGERCWIHGHWSSSESRRSTQNVDHFELYRGSDGLCGEQHVHITNTLLYRMSVRVSMFTVH